MKKISASSLRGWWQRAPNHATLVLLTLSTAQASAQLASPNDAVVPPSSSWGLGVGVFSKQRAYTEAGRETLVVPLLYYENAWLRLAGPTAEVKVARKEFSPGNTVGFGLRLHYDIEGYEADDSPRLAGMQERKSSFWGGAAVTWQAPIATVTAQVLADLSGHSKGSKVQLQLERRFRWGALALTPRVQAQWLDSKYVDYYFGVRSNEANPTRAQFKGSSAMVPEIGVRFDYALQPKQTIYLDVSAAKLPGDIKRSPIVDRSSTSRVSLGYMYRF